LHILPHWNWEGREGEPTPVFVYTNYNKAELFINGKSMGVREKDNTSPQHRYRLMWTDVAYEPGTLRVVAYDDSDRPAAEKEVHTAGPPKRIVLEPDRMVVAANGEDIAFITVSVEDANGIPCPAAADQLQFEVKGAGTFRAACNGDPTSLELFHLPTMKLFSGKLVVLVQSSDVPGEIELAVRGTGLEEGRVVLRSE
jgi:beta-galactosidase